MVNIVPGGRELGAYLVEHPQVDKVAFTGSSASGRLVGARCGELLRPVTLELGGKSAAIVLDDADLGSSDRGAVRGHPAQQRADVRAQHPRARSALAL